MDRCVHKWVHLWRLAPATDTKTHRQHDQVDFNYRLGAFGYLGADALRGLSPSGNPHHHPHHPHHHPHPLHPHPRPNNNAEPKITLTLGPRHLPTGSTGNYGQQDQRFALEWVQRNIKQFGGVSMMAIH